MSIRPREDIIAGKATEFYNENPKTRRGTIYVEYDTSRIKIGTSARYNNIDYLVTGSSEVITGVTKFVDLTDVGLDTLTVGKVLVVGNDGLITLADANSIISTEELYLTPPLQSPTVNYVLFSRGGVGTFVNGIGTDKYNRFDLNSNKINNAIIDCGTYYG
jgi:hypothetical protein